MLNKSMLTYNILTRYENLIDTSKLTDAHKALVVHCAYVACMGAKSKRDSWNRLCFLAQKITEATGKI